MTLVLTHRCSASHYVALSPPRGSCWAGLLLSFILSPHPTQTQLHVISVESPHCRRETAITKLVNLKKLVLIAKNAFHKKQLGHRSPGSEVMWLFCNIYFIHQTIKVLQKYKNITCQCNVLVFLWFVCFAPASKHNVRKEYKTIHN